MKHFLPLLVLLLVAACHKPAPVPPAPEAQVPAPAAPSPAPGGQAPQPPLTLTGTIMADPSRTCRIVAPMDGRIDGLRLMVGDAVKPGQTIAHLSGRDAASLAIKRQQAETKLTLAEQDLRLKQSLFADGLASERELAKAREKKTLAEATLAQLSEVASADIRTPQGGVVLRRDVADGQYVQSGNPLLEVADLSQVWLLADVYEGDIGRVHLGDSVTIVALAYPDSPCRARIDKLHSALDPDSKTMKVRATLPNPGLRLLPGMFATLTVTPSQ